MPIPLHPAARSAGALAGNSRLSALYDAALVNLLVTNTVPGRTVDEPPAFIRAGDHYPEPWTRDAAINAWNAASALSPVVARDTLLMVCEPGPDGNLVIAQDDQWWDQIIWVVAAWHHYLVTGDEEFLAVAWGIAGRSMALLAPRFNAEFGLYRGGSVMQDGIAGYPSPPYQDGNPSTFVLDYPDAHEVMCLSTNCVYIAASDALAAMSFVLGHDAAPHQRAAAELRDAVNRHLWVDELGLYGYLVHGTGDLKGAVSPYQEACGLAFAILLGVADPRQTDSILARTHREPQGVVNVWPHFAERFSDARPGRHNVICWPMVMGMYGAAAATAGNVDAFDEVLQDLERLFTQSNDEFFELYHAISGEPDGGWQHGEHWRSEEDQTWSATAFLRMIHEGLFGMRFTTDGLTFSPAVPARLSGSTLTDFPYRDALINIELHGAGSRVRGMSIDGGPVSSARALPVDLVGPHRIELWVE